MHPADRLIQELRLKEHPEGDWYRETLRSTHVPTPRGDRAASTAIWFLLKAGQVSRWHRVLSDEFWHWCEGGPLQLLLCERPGQDLPPTIRCAVRRARWLVAGGHPAERLRPGWLHRGAGFRFRGLHPDRSGGKRYRQVQQAG